MKKGTSQCVWMCIASGIAFLVLSFGVLNGKMTAWNDSVYQLIATWMNPTLTNIMIGLDFAGAWFVYFFIALSLLMIPSSRKRIGIPVAVAVCVSASLNYTLKLFFAVPRPEELYRLIHISGFGFPSGHAMNTTVFVGMLFFLYLKYAQKKSLKMTACALAVIFIFLMGFSRIYLGVHTATDVIAGYVAGFFVLNANIFVLQRRS